MFEGIFGGKNPEIDGEEGLPEEGGEMPDDHDIAAAEAEAEDMDADMDEDLPMAA